MQLISLLMLIIWPKVMFLTIIILFFRAIQTLEAGKFYNFSLNYQSINIFNFTNVFARLGYSKRSNSIQNNTLISGISSVRSAVNSNLPRESYCASGRIDKRFKNFKAGFNMNFNYSDFNNVVNGSPLKSINFTQCYRATLATNFRDKPNLEIGYSYNKRKYELVIIKIIFTQILPL